MSAKEHNKKLAQKTKKALEELGHDISLGHCYELISKLDDFPNWDTASASEKHLLSNKKLDLIKHPPFGIDPSTLNEALYLGFSQDINIYELVIYKYLAMNLEPHRSNSSYEEMVTKIAGSEEIKIYLQKSFRSEGFDTPPGFDSMEDFIKEIYNNLIVLTHKFLSEPFKDLPFFDNAVDDTLKEESKEEVDFRGILENGMKDIAERLPSSNILAQVMSQNIAHNGRMQLGVNYKGRFYFACEYFQDIPQLQNSKKVPGKKFVEETGLVIWSDVESVCLFELPKKL